MVDERTREYLRQLNKTLDMAEQICNCGYCTAEREKKQIIQCDKNSIIEHLPSKIIRNPTGFIPDLSKNPEHWRSTK